MMNVEGEWTGSTPCTSGYLGRSQKAPCSKIILTVVTVGEDGDDNAFLIYV